MDSHREGRVPGKASERWSIAKQSTVALAAGVGLATVGPAEAGVIYNNFPDVTVQNSFFPLDIDLDSTVDVAFAHGSFGSGTLALAVGYTAGFNSAIHKDPSYGPPLLATRFAAGASIDGSQPYSGYAKLAYTSPSLGQWIGNDGKGFVGVTFGGSDLQEHFGWVGVSVNQTTLAMTICDAGWETEPDTGIAAGAGRPAGNGCSPVPAPPSLALLAVGAAGVLTLRRALRGATQTDGEAQARQN